MIRFGLIGCGGIGLLRAQALAQTEGVTLTAVNDLDAARARGVSAQYGGAVAADWRDLLARADVDAVIVSTPPSLHTDMAVAALQAGKHVLVEKPLARTPAEGRAILQAAEQADRFAATGFNYRFYPSMLKARELLDSGLIGRLDHIRSYTGYSAADHSQAWLHDAQIMGGGALRDNGIHLIDLTCYFLGNVAQVKGFGSNAVWQFEGCEDNGFALLRNAAGNIASLQASWTEWRGYKLLVEIYGEKGCIRAWCFPMLTHVTWADERGGPTRSKWHVFPKTQIMEKLRSYRWVVVESFRQELQAFSRAVKGERTPLATGFDGWRALHVAHLATSAQPEADYA
jgi:predicted dehydrogenase